MRWSQNARGLIGSSPRLAHNTPLKRGLAIDLVYLVLVRKNRLQIEDNYDVWVIHCNKIFIQCIKYFDMKFVSDSSPNHRSNWPEPGSVND